MLCVCMYRYLQIFVKQSFFRFSEIYQTTFCISTICTFSGFLRSRHIFSAFISAQDWNRFTHFVNEAGAMVPLELLAALAFLIGLRCRPGLTPWDQLLAGPLQGLEQFLAVPLQDALDMHSILSVQAATGTPEDATARALLTQDRGGFRWDILQRCAPMLAQLWQVVAATPDDVRPGILSQSHMVHPRMRATGGWQPYWTDVCLPSHILRGMVEHMLNQLRPSSLGAGTATGSSPNPWLNASPP
jgi:hypothetical protein